VTGLFEQILLENVAYLVDDERRQRVFRALADEVGTTPEAILAVTPKKLAAVIRDGGMKPPMRAKKLITAARIANDLGGIAELSQLMRRHPKAARPKLKKFPGFGEPGVDRVLLYAHCSPGLAPDSNALRVLVRLGFAKEQKSYDLTYRTMRLALEPLLPRTYEAQVTARQVLRRHGQDVCTNTAPKCAECVLVKQCDFAARQRKPAQTSSRLKTSKRPGT
jgi:endonuclease-3